MRYILVLVLFLSSVYSCSLCSIYSPNAHIKTTIEVKEKDTHFDISWQFDENFVKTLNVYDENSNNIFDPQEIKEIEKALVIYLNDTEYLTHISYTKKDQNITKKNIYTPKDVIYTLDLQSDKMIFSYAFELPIVLKENKKLMLEFYDEGNNFNFIAKDTIVKNYHKTKIIQLEANQIFIYFYNPMEEIKKEKTPIASPDVNKIDTQNYLIDTLREKLAFYKNKMELLLEDIKQNNSFISYIWLLLFSFFYGVLHALGPGHGKSLVGAYFLSENRSISKAASISAMIGLVHTFSAFIMTLVVYYLFSVLFSNFFLDVEQITAKISAIIIISIALYMIVKKIKHNTQHKHGNHSCGCGACKSKTTDLGVIISAGIVPCPGTVTIFLFTFGLGIVFVGFLSAIAMSIGMSLVIFITAYLSSKVRKSTSNNTKLVKFFEYGSLVFILGLGIILLVV